LDFFAITGYYLKNSGCITILEAIRIAPNIINRIIYVTQNLFTSLLFINPSVLPQKLATTPI